MGAGGVALASERYIMQQMEVSSSVGPHYRQPVFNVVQQYFIHLFLLLSSVKHMIPF